MMKWRGTTCHAESTVCSHTLDKNLILIPYGSSGPNRFFAYSYRGAPAGGHRENQLTFSIRKAALLMR